jgi:hypothetical protein
MTNRWPYRTRLVALISKAVSLAPVALASFLASFSPAAAQSPAPGNGTHSPPFTATLSNITPLVVGAIPPGQAGRLEGRLGPQLDVATASRHICNPQQMDQPWDKISS